MSTLRQAAQRALKAMEDGEDRADMIEFSEALIALRAALAEPQTTHWEGCEAVHPECKAFAEPEQEPLTEWARVDSDLNVTHLDMDLCAKGPHNSYTALAVAIWNAALEEAAKYAAGDGDDVLADSIRELKK